MDYNNCNTLYGLGIEYALTVKKNLNGLTVIVKVALKSIHS